VNRRLVFRVIGIVPSVIVASLVVFALERLIPGGPAEALAGSSATAQSLAALNHQLGLDHPVYTLYWTWITGVLHGDFGSSYAGGQSVGSVIGPRIEPTVEIVLLALVISLVVGVVVGVVAAAHQRSKVVRVVFSASAFGIAIPDFWFASLLVGVFALVLRVVPATGFSPLSVGLADNLQSVILPVVTLSVINAAIMARQVRSAMLDVLAQPYIRAARAAGVGTGRIRWRYALSAAAPPVITLIPLLVAGLVGGSVVVENVMNIPGLGTGIVQAVTNRDYPTLQAIVLLMAVVVILLNLAADLVSARLDPRLRRG
jgi:peptide/nickel transport system permease protein